MNSIAWWPVLIALGVASAIDICTHKIPNWLTVPFFAAGLLLACFGLASVTPVQSLEGAALAAALAGVLCLMRGMGMGDLKLCVAIGAWIGPGQLFFALIVTGIAGGVMAIVWALFRRIAGEALDGAGDLLFGFWRRGFATHPTLNLDNPAKAKMPYAPAIALGTLFSFFAR